MQNAISQLLLIGEIRGEHGLYVSSSPSSTAKKAIKFERVLLNTKREYDSKSTKYIDLLENC